MFSLAQHKKLVKCFPKYIQKRLPKEVAVINISAKESRHLNLLYRKKDKPANVLSFRYGKDYGEILLCSEVVKKDAKQSGNPQNEQMTRMLIHAMLHLGGVHHENGVRHGKKFVKLEELILKNVSIGKSKVKSQKSK